MFKEGEDEEVFIRMPIMIGIKFGFDIGDMFRDRKTGGEEYIFGSK